MECPLTGKPCEKPKPYSITEIENGQVYTFKLCEDCILAYIEKQKSNPVQKTVNVIQKLVKTLGTLLGMLTKTKPEPEPEPESKPEKILSSMDIRCPVCGSAFTDLASKMKFGCPQCFETFSGPTIHLVKTLQDGLKHVGKVPKTHGVSHKSKKKINPARYLAIKQGQMEDAVVAEDYEKAALIRDQMQIFENLIHSFKEASEQKDQQRIVVTYREIRKFVDNDQDYG